MFLRLAMYAVGWTGIGLHRLLVRGRRAEGYGRTEYAALGRGDENRGI